MIIAMAADHGGYELKNAIRDHLTAKGYQVADLGTNSGESVDYPEYGYACGKAVADGRAELGIVCCGSGIGISMAANKVPGAWLEEEWLGTTQERHARRVAQLNELGK